jgi:hypothetical protein
VSEDVLYITNLEPGDTTFLSDRGSYNVTRAARDCEAGKHGLPHRFGVRETMDAARNVAVDQTKVSALLADPAGLVRLPPLIFIEEQGKVWLIDGHHRLHAMARLGYEEVAGYVIRKRWAKRYCLSFNGKRVAPWYERRKHETKTENDQKD